MTSLELTQPTVLDSMQVLRDFADAVIASVPEQDDERLIEIGRDANSLSKAAFRIRGSVAMEIKSRVIARHKGPGRPEIGKAMSQAAKDMDIAPSTLGDDCAIWESFSEHLRGDAELDREFFRTALSAPDPQQAIAYAFDAKAQNETFSTRDFREYVSRLNGGEDREKVESEHWVKVLLLNGADEDLRELCKHRNQDINTAVSQAIKEAADYSREKKGNG